MITGQHKLVFRYNGELKTVDEMAKIIGVSRSGIVAKLKDNHFIPLNWGKGKQNYNRIVIDWTDELEELLTVEHPVGDRCGETQLCWDCEFSAGGCPWSDNFILPKGAKAHHSERIYNKGEYRKVVDTYFITECPRYQHEKPRMLPEYTWKEQRGLLRAIIEQTVDDYSKALQKAKAHPESMKRENVEEAIRRGYHNSAYLTIRECERFFRGAWFSQICDELDIRFTGDDFIRVIRKNPQVRFKEQKGESEWITQN